MDDIRLVIGVDDRDVVRSLQSTKRFERNILDVERAFRKGNITSAAYNRALANQAKELAKLGGTYNKANSEIRKYAAQLRKANDEQLEATYAMNQYGRVADASTRRLKRFGAVGMQQVGYQVGDFAVQVQGGTSALVALGQQGSQLLGIMGPYGALAGALLAIGTAIGNVALEAYRARDGVKSFAGSLEELEEAISKYSGAQELLDEALTNPFVRANQALKDYLYSVRESAFRAVVGSIRANLEESVISPLDEAINKYESKIKSLEITLKRGFDENITREINKLNTYIDILRLAQSDVMGATFGQNPEEIAQNLLNLRRQLIQQGSIENQQLIKNIDSLLQSEELLGLIVEAARERQKTEEELQGDLEEAERIQQEIIDNQRVLLTGAEAFSSVWSGIVQKLKDANTEQKNLAFRQANLPLGQGGGTARMLALLQSGRTMEDRSGFMREGQMTTGRIEDRREEQKAVTELTKSYNLMAFEVENNVVAALEEFYRIQERNKDLAEFVGSTFEDSFMSIVDGTSSVSDAFKNMAAEIIKELYRVLVVQQMVGAISGFIGGLMPVGSTPLAATNPLAGVPGSQLLPPGFAKGGAFSGGNVIPFARGGVVGGPTMFPMAGGRTGLMGEAGPEAILPLKRGPGGKLGVSSEGGGITQNLVFNIAANGDESVKRIVRQEAPRIAEQAKAAVADAKMRGGSYGRAFR